MKSSVIFICMLIVMSCTVITEEEIRSFSEIASSYEITNSNGYDCKKIDQTVIERVLSKGVAATNMDIHDQYSTTGCSVEGKVTLDGVKQAFKFDYGGILYLDNGDIFGCGEDCCADGFVYCTWEKANAN